MSLNSNASDPAPVSGGPSERGLKWSEAWRQRSYRAWPPPNTQSYPVWMPTHMDRLAVAHLSAAPNLDDERDEANAPSAYSSLRTKWQQLADTKLQVFGLRSSVKKARTRTRRARTERDTADNAFMSAIRHLSACPPPATFTFGSAQFQELFQALQATRNSCQDDELYVEGLEESLECSENHLDFLERQLINELPKFSRPWQRSPWEPTKIAATTLPQPDILGLDIDPITESQSLYQHSMNTVSQSDLLLGLEIRPETTKDPMYQDLITAVKTYQSARNDRINMLTRKANVEEHNRHLKFLEKHNPAALRYVTQLRDSDLEFLLEFGAEERKVLHELGRLAGEVDRLVQLCWEDGCWPRDTPLEDVRSWYHPISFDLDDDFKQDSSTTTNVEFSILLSNPTLLVDIFPNTLEEAVSKGENLTEGHSSREAITKEFFIMNLFQHETGGDKLDYIDRWLLQRLRTSPFEVDLLYSTFLMADAIDVLDIDEWQEDVLNHWWTDEAGKIHFQNLKNFRNSSATRPSSPPSWLSDPMIWSTEASEAEVDIYTGPISEAEEHQSSTSDSAMSLTTTKALKRPPPFYPELQL